MTANYEIPYEKVVYFPGVVDDIDTLIEKIESTNSIAVSPWGLWYASSDVNGHVYGELKSFNKGSIDQETDADIKSDSEYVINKLISHMVDAVNTYAEIYSIDDKEKDYAIQALNQEGTRYGINKYYENQYMGPHVDWNDFNSDITYTIVVYLNDDYEGGELYFVRPEIDIKIKPKAGSIVMFPSVEPYLHQSCDIPKGRKMLITHHWKNDSKTKLQELI